MKDRKPGLRDFALVALQGILRDPQYAKAPLMATSKASEVAAHMESRIRQLEKQNL